MLFYHCFGDLKQQSAAVMINPKDSKAGFGSPYLAAYYILFFDAKAFATA